MRNCGLRINSFITLEAIAALPYNIKNEGDEEN